jgi:hypothetical protein
MSNPTFYSTMVNMARCCPVKNNPLTPYVVAMEYIFYLTILDEKAVGNPYFLHMLLFILSRHASITSTRYGEPTIFSISGPSPISHGMQSLKFVDLVDHDYYTDYSN